MSSSPKSEAAEPASGAVGAIGAIIDRLLRGHAYRELGAARLFEDGRALAPTAALADVIAGHAAEERAHYRAVIAVWAAFAQKPPATMEARAEARLRERPLPVVASWYELAMAQFLFDRAGLWQIAEYAACGFLPYRALAASILGDERAHQDFGAEEIARAGAAGAPPDASAVFARWLAAALRSFGRPDSDGDRAAVAAELKRRPAAAVMRDFIADIKPTIARAGLAFPAPAALDVVLPPALAAALG
ncbi:MAG TPA: Phenylacetic acid catabolic protein [Polyangia bacterium]|nr:Phenylacetic acid catabolic protein [Polyangia bacterium]